MKVGVTVTFTDGTSVSVACGYAAKSALEKRENASLPQLLERGLRQSDWAFMAWNQAVIDETTVDPWAVWEKQIDDVELGEGPDPTGAVKDPLPDSSSSSPPVPESHTGS